ncbi:MAG: helix-turn-helix domain-containing protein [Lactococcus cremoris]
MKTIHKPEYIELISKLRNARLAKNISQKNLASALNLTQATVSKIENCERRLDIIEFLKWIEILKIDIHSILKSGV